MDGYVTVKLVVAEQIQNFGFARLSKPLINPNLFKYRDKKQRHCIKRYGFVYNANVINWLWETISHFPTGLKKTGASLL